MKKQLASLLLLALVSTSAVGCSVGSQDVIDTANDLKKQAEDAVNQLQQNGDLNAFLNELPNITEAQADKWLDELLTGPIIQQATEKLGEDAVAQIIEDVITGNNGVLDAIAIQLITQEIEKRLGAQ